MSHGERRLKIAARGAAQKKEATDALEPATNILPHTLKKSHSGYVSQKTFATECSKHPAANLTL